MKIRIPIIALIAIMIAFTQCGKDDGGSTTPDITVTTADLTASIDENPAAGAVIGTVTGSTNSGSVTFSLLTESIAGALSINSSNGQLLVADETVFDFETNPTITGTVQVANGSVMKTANVTVTVNDVDEGAATVIWTGTTMTFSKAANADPTASANQDRITDKVWLTRANDKGGLYNAVSETVAGSTSPAGTQWASGTTADIATLSFGTMRSVGKPKDLVNQDLVLRLVEENIYIDFKLTAWSTGGGGGNGGTDGSFSYERSTPN